jgi:hypothetical protein
MFIKVYRYSQILSYFMGLLDGHFKNKSPLFLRLSLGFSSQSLLSSLQILPRLRLKLEKGATIITQLELVFIC